MKIYLISCVKKKREITCTAKEMYTSPLFKGAYKYAQKMQADKTFILSAKYGLLHEDDIIEPYNETLNTKHQQEVYEWSNRVLSQLIKVANIEKDTFVFLAGEKYRKFLLPKINNYDIPLQGLSIGKQLAFYKENT